MVRRDDQHGIDILPFEDAPEILRGVRCCPPFRRNPLAPAPEDD
jgi:hypothetical protein